MMQFYFATWKNFENQTLTKMKTNALYFPYINIPKSEWLYAMALYWDKISAIVPFEYLHNPERLTPFMRELVSNELVQQIIPQDYISIGEPAFAEPFLTYVEGRLAKIPKLPKRNKIISIQIHREKIDGDAIAKQLQTMGVLQPGNHSWYNVTDWVGNAYMAYLASCLGIDPKIDAKPLTDDKNSYRMLNDLGLEKNSEIELRKVRARKIVLKSILPVPSNNFDIPKLIRFKTQNFERLRKFRNRIEGICLDLANRPAFDEGQVKTKAGELQDEVNDLTLRMKTSWRDIALRDFLPLVPLGISLAEPVSGSWKVIGAGASLVAAVAQFSISVRESIELRNEPLAYAALAKKSFWERLNAE